MSVVLKNGTKVKIKRSIWGNFWGFLKLQESQNIDRGTTGTIVGRKWWKGRHLYKVDFGHPHGVWGVKRSDLEVVGGKRHD